MKRFLLIIILLAGFHFYSEATDYYSALSGDANNLSNWKTFPGGIDAASFTAGGDRFIIQNGHTMTTSATWTIGNATTVLWIQSGGTLGGNHLIQFDGTFQIDNGGTYIHNNNGPVDQVANASIFGGTASFAPHSNFEIRNWQGFTYNLPYSPSITWGNLVINLQVNFEDDWYWRFPHAYTLNILGNLDIRSTYHDGTPHVLALSWISINYITIGGDLLISGNTTRVYMKKNNNGNVSGYTTMQVNGNVTMRDNAYLNIGPNTYAYPNIYGPYELRYKGDLSVSAGNTITATGRNAFLVANGTAPQTLTCIPHMTCNYRVEKDAIVNLGCYFYIGVDEGSFFDVVGELNDKGFGMNAFKIYVTGGVFNCTGPFKAASCVACMSRGVAGINDVTLCDSLGKKGRINFTSTTLTLGDGTWAGELVAGWFLYGNSPGEIYLVNSSANIPLFNPGNEYVLVATGSVLSLDGNSYLAGNGAVLYASRGTLRIGSANGITATGNTTTGNIRISGLKNYNLMGITNFEYFGTTPQVTGNGLPTTIGGTLTINNSAGISSMGVTLSQLTNINGTLNLTLGKLRAAITAPLNINSTGIIVGGSANSFIGGPLRVTGKSSFVFPVGINAASAPTGSIYAPVTMTHSTGTVNPGDVVSVEYIRNNPQTAISNTLQAGLNHISFLEYWNISASNPATTKQWSLQVNPQSFCYNLNTLKIASFNSSSWMNRGNTATTTYGSSPPLVWGQVTSDPNSPVSAFYTIATTDPFSANPLPIDLVSFDTRKQTVSSALASWELAGLQSASMKFEVQRAGTDKLFATISIVYGEQSLRSYHFMDNALQPGINYYRLKMTDEMGKITYSRVVVILNNADGVLLASLIPTRVTNSAMLTIGSPSKQKIGIIITDMQGRVVYKQNYTVAKGNTSIEISTTELSTGVYQLAVIAAEDKTNLIRFIKQ